LNPLHSRHMMPKERQTEVCRLLALGLIRLRGRELSQVSADLGESSLHFVPTRAVMQNRNDGEAHDRPHPRARGRAEDHADA
jgi:hypothetical protein